MLGGAAQDRGHEGPRALQASGLSRTSCAIVPTGLTATRPEIFPDACAKQRPVPARPVPEPGGSPSQCEDVD